MSDGSRAGPEAAEGREIEDPDSAGWIARGVGVDDGLLLNNKKNWGKVEWERGGKRRKGQPYHREQDRFTQIA